MTVKHNYLFINQLKPSLKEKCIPPSKNIPTIPQQDARITCEHFKHCILGLMYRNTF